MDAKNSPQLKAATITDDHEGERLAKKVQALQNKISDKAGKDLEKKIRENGGLVTKTDRPPYLPSSLDFRDPAAVHRHIVENYYAWRDLYQANRIRYSAHQGECSQHVKALRRFFLVFSKIRDKSLKTAKERQELDAAIVDVIANHEKLKTFPKDFKDFAKLGTTGAPGDLGKTMPRNTILQRILNAGGGGAGGGKKKSAKKKSFASFLQRPSFRGEASVRDVELYADGFVPEASFLAESEEKAELGPDGAGKGPAKKPAGTSTSKKKEKGNEKASDTAQAGTNSGNETTKETKAPASKYEKMSGHDLKFLCREKGKSGLYTDGGKDGFLEPENIQKLDYAADVRNEVLKIKG
eukprot:g14550.t1